MFKWENRFVTVQMECIRMWCYSLHLFYKPICCTRFVCFFFFLALHSCCYCCGWCCCHSLCVRLNFLRNWRFCMRMAIDDVMTRIWRKPTNHSPAIFILHECFVILIDNRFGIAMDMRSLADRRWTSLVFNWRWRKFKRIKKCFSNVFWIMEFHGASASNDITSFY